MQPDPTKPNHYYHDILGDPDLCDEDHNHPPREMGTVSKRVADWLAFAVGGGVALLFILGVITLVQALFG